MPSNSVEYRIQHKRLNKKRKRWWLNLYKQSHGCKKCGRDFENEELDIHHLDPSKKTIQPTKMVRDEWSIQRMLGELEHCCVLCKQCHIDEHRRPTFGTSGSYID